MASIIEKESIGEQDFSRYDGINATFTRDTSTGGTITLNKVGDSVDCLMVYGGGVNYTDTTIQSALTAIGAVTKVSLVLRPGIWVISDNLSITSNITLKIPAGATISVAVGKTLTFADAKQIDIGTYYVDVFSGTGSVAITGGSTSTPASSLTAAVLKSLLYPSASSGSLDLANNLKPVVDANVNILDIYTKSGGAVPDSTNFFTISIPDGNGYTQRTRKTAYLSGTSQITLADAAGYWGRASDTANICTAWLYAIWDGTGIVWALAGYAGFTMVPVTTVATDDDYFLLEGSSTYTRNAAHYCVAVARIKYKYNTADAPDHTVQATVENAPQVIWNPKSDYAGTRSLATTYGSSYDFADYSAVNCVVKQTGKYLIIASTCMTQSAVTAIVYLRIRTGSSTYGSATIRTYARDALGHEDAASVFRAYTTATALVQLNNGDTIHLGAGMGAAAGSGTGQLLGDDTYINGTHFIFKRVD